MISDVTFALPRFFIDIFDDERTAEGRKHCAKSFILAMQPEWN